MPFRNKGGKIKAFSVKVKRERIYHQKMCTNLELKNEGKAKKIMVNICKNMTDYLSLPKFFMSRMSTESKN